MKYLNSVLETVGNTPLIRLHRVVSDVPALVLAKVETYNPGLSIKDRIAVRIIEEAERTGKLRVGSTIVECTSGNTGIGLAMVAAVKGYKIICTVNDKQSKEKIQMLRSWGAEVIVCPSKVRPEDPRSNYSVAEQISKELPNSYWVNQYENPMNPFAHYESTGPEIWAATEGSITHLVAPTGTGGSLCGTARYLKEMNPNIKIWGVDAYGSVLKKYHETGIFDEKEIYEYSMEGVGREFIPRSMDLNLIDRFEKVTDKDSALMGRRLVREEGLWLGHSSGSAISAIKQLRHLLKPTDVVVVICHDHGSRYMGKIYSDDWMRSKGFLDEQKETHSRKPVGELVEDMQEFQPSATPARTNFWAESTEKARFLYKILRGVFSGFKPLTSSNKL
jgi:cystathionine beta-synthase